LHDAFPTSKENFKAYFLVHPTSTKVAKQQTVTVSCILCSLKLVKNIKFDKIDPSPVIDWLHLNKIIIKVDAPGHEVTWVVGHLLHVHPKITHPIYLKDTLEDNLHHVKISPKEVIALNSSAQAHYQLAMDSSNDTTTFVPPFELFPTELGSSLTDNCVSTIIIGIKPKQTITIYCMNYSLACLPSHPHIEFSVCGMASIVQHTKYQSLLRGNNKFFTSLATILISGIDNLPLASKLWLLTLQTTAR